MMTYLPTHAPEIPDGGRRCERADVDPASGESAECGLLADEHARLEDVQLGRQLERAEIQAALRATLAEYRAAGLGEGPLRPLRAAIRRVEVRS